MSDLPRRVLICEEGPREGFQALPQLPTADKVRLIEALAATGLAQIDCASFVSPKLVPQMADAEAVAAALAAHGKRPGVRYMSLWLSEGGFRRALTTPLDVATNVMVVVSSTAAQKNNGCSGAELVRRQGGMIDLYRAHGYGVDYAHVSTAFGCTYEGRIGADQAIATMAELFAVCDDHGARPAVVYLSDSVGMATPAAVTELVAKARSRWPEQEFALHLHDTRGMGLANAWAGLQLGITRFDASIGGMGGCPFSGATGAIGNICTEDLASMCNDLGIETGIDLDALIDCAHLAEEIIGRPLPGRIMRTRARQASTVS